MHHDAGGDCAEGREQRQLLGLAELVDAVERSLGLGGGEHVVVAGGRGSQHVASGLGDLERMAAQPRVVGQEHVCLLRAALVLPAHEAPNGLTEEQFGRHGGGVHADAQTRDVDALADHAHGDQPRRVGAGELADAAGRCGVVADHHLGRHAEVAPDQLGDALRVLLVDGDDQTACIGLAAG